jgi:hypothetical protein
MSRPDDGSQLRCQARIWPSSWNGWGQCPGHVMPDGNCSAYGSQHGADPPTAAPTAHATSVLVARCENVHEPDGTPCTGRLAFRWGQSEAACDTCGGRCGIAVADWLTVQPDGPTAATEDELREQIAELIYDRDSFAGDLPWSRTHPVEKDRCRRIAADVLALPVLQRLAEQAVNGDVPCP